MCLRWTAAGLLEAETRFGKVQGYRGLATLAVKIEQDLIRKRQLDRYTSSEEEVAALATSPGNTQDLSRESDSLNGGATVTTDDSSGSGFGRRSAPEFFRGK